ncbi:RusA family crossover junction endodeoxyribonuclease [Chengkuizengella axinellae]|uniref:RusA family crossover junction endodeoxyribonuclease n=1 Tax=Chengkuizengella axinellae TaxID=3064388 RepID=A0ABT9J6L4_9BACL|nr:RusA family crossover junction endodeoxyribonuclease [Chengkuizengella sp. 2205SS18-9]MDP5277249.1 RusA family crossover junction endodeoxyribonuclease [Chengkuizengella sp. 2205SS18-9]
MIKFVVHEEPVAQGRPRVTTKNGKPRLYDPDKSKHFKQLVAMIAKQYAPETLLDCPLVLRITFYRSIPTRFTKAERRQIQSGELRPITKPDIDNYVKAIKDALNKVIWTDDSKVVDLHAGKYYSDKPRVEIEILELSA